MAYDWQRIQSLTPERRQTELAAALYHVADSFDPSSSGHVPTVETELAAICRKARELAAEVVDLSPGEAATHG